MSEVTTSDSDISRIKGRNVKAKTCLLNLCEREARAPVSLIVTRFNYRSIIDRQRW